MIIRYDYLNNTKMKILKFGGKSLANGEGLERVVQTIAQKYFNNEHGKN